jgi:hypothetical protein
MKRGCGDEQFLVEVRERGLGRVALEAVGLIYIEVLVVAIYNLELILS